VKGRLLGPWKNAQLSDSRLRTGGGALERSNKYSQIVFTDSFLFLIISSPDFSFMGAVGKKSS
jgi:hypothetical protein